VSALVYLTSKLAFNLFEKINQFIPDVFIVPDAWNDSAITLRNAKSWMINYKQHLPEGVRSHAFRPY
jgi:hypothetical protein